MAEYTYKQLKGMTVAKLREIADGIKDDALEGHSTMHKEHLLPRLCKVLGLEEHHAAHGAAKLKIKSQIRRLRSRRDELHTSGDHAQLARVRHNIHVLKHRLRRMASPSS
jgi:hypothetical protein